MRPVLRSRTGPLVGSRLSPDRALRRVCSCSDATDGEWIWIGSESVNRQNIELKHLTRYPVLGRVRFDCDLCTAVQYCVT